ncbi:long-chain-fatty-acid--CoA ligase 1 isoform X3 [Oryzias melastigma]|uniref:long-chain-fatty-acid--CoA ligase 1 isoform X3 n=1 Tax=Oryzias melastigma TaxID=30732 RepID=UPI00168CDD32|nr:long-chain-fatty-acid--CoA ligase 1 isoform X3 [Oryzias melastigma]
MISWESTITPGYCLVQGSRKTKGRQQIPIYSSISIMVGQDFLRRLNVPDLEEISHCIKNASAPLLVSVGAIAAATTYYLATRPKALAPLCDLHRQSVEVEGEGLARRSVFADDGSFLTHIYEDAKTMYESFLRGIKVSQNGPCLGSRKPKQPYEWISYGEVKQRSENLGSAFLHKGHSKSVDPHIGIFSQNRPEWTMTELACHTYSLVSVPLYDTLGTEAISYVINKASISTVVCDVKDKVNLILDCFKDSKHSLKTIVLMEEPNESLVERAREAGIQILSLAAMEALGKANHQQPIPPQPEDMAVICFTSGTTGNPKGAMLTHGNIMSNCSSFVKLTEFCCPIDHTDVHISYLPLAHMFERVVQGSMLLHGARIGFFQGDIRWLFDDLHTLKPTFFPGVPRLLNRIYDKVYGQANSSLKRWLLQFAYNRKEAELRRGIVRKDSIWDQLIFKKVQFYEGYGQTECTAGCTITLPGDFSEGHVGPPLPCNIIKLMDVPEMNYYAVNGEGEVCVKGSNVFKGYLRDPEKTAETIDADGWVHTGDIGKWLPNGTLKIVDRKKHIFKLAQGEYIAPEKIENIYTRSDAVAQVFVHGDSLQAFLVAVVVPDPEFLSGWAERKLNLQGSYKELCGKEKVKAAILEDMLRLGKEGGLKSFEQVKAIYVHTELFSIENGLLTPTLKSKRNEMRQYFRSQIDELYQDIKM